MVNVIIISEINVYIIGLQELLSANSPINVVGTANDVKSAITLLSEEVPHVALLDVATRCSCDLVTQITQLGMKTKIVAFGVSRTQQNILDYAKAGINCYVTKDAPLEELLKAISEAANGESYCPVEITKIILDKMRVKNTLTETHNGNRFNSHLNQNLVAQELIPNVKKDLTRRECQVVELLSEGQSNKQIANHLCIEISTVKNHVHNLLVKLNARNRAQAVYLLTLPHRPDTAGSSPDFSSVG